MLEPWGGHADDVRAAMMPWLHATYIWARGGKKGTQPDLSWYLGRSWLPGESAAMAGRRPRAQTHTQVATTLRAALSALVGYVPPKKKKPAKGR